jgi:hypothetical protein
MLCVRQNGRQRYSMTSATISGSRTNTSFRLHLLLSLPEYIFFIFSKHQWYGLRKQDAFVSVPNALRRLSMTQDSLWGSSHPESAPKPPRRCIHVCAAVPGLHISTSSTPVASCIFTIITSSSFKSKMLVSSTHELVALPPPNSSSPSLYKFFPTSLPRLTSSSPRK